MDYGDRYTDKKISAVNRELRKTYRTAQAELKKKLADFEKRHAKANKRKKEQLADGKISQQDYKDWLTGQVFIRNQWQANLRQVCQVMQDCNKQAMNIVNTSRFDVFAENYNYNAWKAEKSIAVSFNLYNAESVARLINGDPQLLPEWKIDEQKDYRWNQKKVNNIIRQGIIQGEGIPEITERLCRDLATGNENKMRMFARTALGAAQSAGRQKQMEDAAAMGIEVHKRWIAAHDNRTRDAHRDLDGQEVPYDKPFDSELGEIMFPKDPTAEPANVFNCRCTMRTIYPKYEDRSKQYGEDETIDGQTYEEWKKGKKARGETQGTIKTPQNIADIRTNLAFIHVDKDGNVISDVSGEVRSSSEKWKNYTEKVEYGELFNPVCADITKSVIEQVEQEYPLSFKLGIVGDSRIIRGLDTDIDGLDLGQELGFGAHYLWRNNAIVGGGKAGIEIALESYSTTSLADDFRARHELRKKYGWQTEKTAFGTVSDTLAGTIIHEYAHAIQDEYGLFGGARSPRAVKFSEWLYQYHANHKEEARQMSNYAADHPFEMMAEAFVQLHDVEHTDTVAYAIAKEIWDEFDDYAKKKGRWTE